MYVVVEHNYSSGRDGSTTFDVSERFVPNQIFFVVGKSVLIGGLARSRENSSGITSVAGYVRLQVYELTANSFTISINGQYAIDNNGYSTTYKAHVFYR